MWVFVGEYRGAAVPGTLETAGLKTSVRRGGGEEGGREWGQKQKDETGCKQREQLVRAQNLEKKVAQPQLTGEKADHHPPRP